MNEVHITERFKNDLIAWNNRYNAEMLPVSGSHINENQLMSDVPKCMFMVVWFYKRGEEHPMEFPREGPCMLMQLFYRIRRGWN